MECLIRGKSKAFFPFRQRNVTRNRLFQVCADLVQLAWISENIASRHQNEMVKTDQRPIIRRCHGLNRRCDIDFNAMAHQREGIPEGLCLIIIIYMSGIIHDE